MKIAAYHARFEKRPKLSDFSAALIKDGFTPSFQEARELLLSRLRPFGISTPIRAFLNPGPMEIYTSSDRAIFMRTHLSSGSREQRPSVSDILLLTDGELADMEAIIHQVIQTPLHSHSWAEMRTIEGLKERLGDLSPNGKMLADRSLRTSIRRLYDDGLRERLGSIITTFGDTPAPRPALERLDQSEKSLEPLDFVNSEFASSHFVILCDSCETPPYLAFEDQAKAEAIVADVGRKCVACGKRKLSVIETFAIKEPYVRGLQQGLWLESLASDVLTLYTDAAWTGQMVELNEIDVLGVYMDRTILIECKDTSFGQNDLYITAIKAQQVDADLVIIISTNDIHPNVREGAAKMGGRRERREFQVISNPSAEVIKNDLTIILDKLSQGYISRWLGGGPLSPYLYERFMPDESSMATFTAPL